MAKILIMDIETAPNVAYVWGAWKQNVYQKQWVSKSYIMTVAWKWLGDDTVHHFVNRNDDNDLPIVAMIYSLFDEADIVVAHNGKRFDIPTVQARGLVHGLHPPSPYWIVDTLLVAKKELRVVSNSLENLCEELNLHRKSGHKKFPGFELWSECMKGNDEAWDEMVAYNIDDVISLEDLYLRLRPYMKNHPHVGREDDVVCPKCGGTHLQSRGYYYSKAGLCYQRFWCVSCGGWSRERYSEKDMAQNLRNAV